AVVAGEEIGQRHDCSVIDEILAAKSQDARPAAGPGAADDVAEAIVVQIADRHISPVAEHVFEQKEIVEEVRRLAAIEQRRAVVAGDARAAAEPRGYHDVVDVVAVDVADRGPRTAPEVRIINAEEVGQHLSIWAIEK